MARLNLKAVEERVAPLAGRERYNREFVFDLLLAYGKPQSSITRLRNGDFNVAANPSSEVAQKKVVYFKEASGDPLEELEELKASPDVVRFSTRFVIVTNYAELVAHDTQTGEIIGFPIGEIDQHFTFFLPWAGMEKAQYVAEAHADVKAAERMGKLFDELLHANPRFLDDSHGRHALNMFFTRLLFCYFAEDTGIFAENQFTNAVASLTLDDGSDMEPFLRSLFAALDTPRVEDKPKHLAAFPYVNGRLFTTSPEYVVPTFTKKARQELIDAGKLIWREINPDIFGSMFQAIVTPGNRSDLGQHYTSVPNILKTIEPLFLNALKDELDDAFDSDRRLVRLLERISAIKVFDPACGSGNFLVIAYKELRKLEHAILERLNELRGDQQGQLLGSRINVESFFGIEIDDFAVEVAILSLWIAKHQMNVEFREKFGIDLPLIPLKETGQVRQGNAARVDWNDVCRNDGSEIYLIGNPPYAGAKTQTKDQKLDFDFVFGRRPYSKNLDYIALWFVRGSDYIRDTRAELAFVTTNSVTQGEHVGLMFPMILDMGLEIGYAYTSFKWENNAKRNAGVTVAVISLRAKRIGRKFIFSDGLQIEAKNINGYLADGDNIFIARRTKPLSPDFPPMVFGNMPLDGGGLILSQQERDTLLDATPDAAQFVRPLVGSHEFLNGTTRWCVWVKADQVAAAARIPEIDARFTRTKEFREASTDAGTRAKAGQFFRFREQREATTIAVMIPRHSSENRVYLPMGLFDPGTVVADSANVIYDPEPWVFAILTSRMHLAWIRAVAGQLETRIRYSNTIVYNNFPVPPLSEAVKDKLVVAGLRVLDVREYHCESTPGDLYDPEHMPNELRDAHAAVDALVDSIYSNRPYETDEQRLSDLFARYESMIAEEAAKVPAKKTWGPAK